MWAFAAVVAAAVSLFVLWRRPMVRRAMNILLGRPITARVSQLWVFPIKGCSGISLTEAKLDEGGIRFDREFVIVVPSSGGEQKTRWSMITLRECPKLALVQPSFETGRGGSTPALSDPIALRVAVPSGASARVPLRVSRRALAAKREFLMHRTMVEGTDQGDRVADMLSQFLGRDVRLLRMQGTPRKRLADDPKYAPLVTDFKDDGGVTRFADWSPFSLLSDASHRYASRVYFAHAFGEAGPNICRFRTNIIVGAGARGTQMLPFEEDSWAQFRVGATQFAFLKRCGRCLVPIVDPKTGERSAGGEPLRSLRRFRAGRYPHIARGAKFDSAQAFYAINCRHFLPAKGPAVLRVGDPVNVHGYRGVWQRLAVARQALLYS